MTTLKFLLFVGAFVAILGVIIPLISETAESAETGDIEYAIGDSGKLYVMKTPANYVRTLFVLNPTSNVMINALNFYFYADHDVTYYYDGAENYFTLYVNIEDPTSGYSQTENWENFDPSRMNWEFAGFYLENVNLSWDNNYNVTVDVEDDRSVGVSTVYWTFPITVNAVIPREAGIPSFFAWMWAGTAWGGEMLIDGIRSVIWGGFEVIVGKDVSDMVGSFLANIGRVLTMDFGGIPDMVRVMLVLPIWIGIGYITLIIVRSFIPFIGGGSHG